MIKYYWSGKFETKSDKWIHISRKLNEYELIIVDEGTLFIGDENKSYAVHQNEYLIMAPCDYQHGTAPSACSFHWLHFDFAEEFHIPCPLQGKINSWSNVHALLNVIFRSDQSNHTLVSNQILEALLYELSYDAKNQKAPTVKKKVDAYITWNQDGIYKVYDIAKQLGYNEKYISKLFYKETGIPLKRYLMEHTLEKAKNLLLNTQDNIEEISLRCGYSDAHNFSRMIKSELGMSPSRFREIFKQK